MPRCWARCCAAIEGHPGALVLPDGRGHVTWYNVLVTATVYYRDEPLLEARARYFSDNAFGDDGGYSAKWAKVEIGPIPFWFPNSAARVRALRYHDLHHVVTGYPTTLIGEAEIGAWEIASGCGNKYVAWYLNLQAMILGMYISPRRVFQAFLRGRQSDNLYATAFGDELLARTVGDVRDDLRLGDEPPRSTPGDRRAFFGWLMAGSVVSITNLGLVLLPLGAVAGLVCWLRT